MFLLVGINYVNDGVILKICNTVQNCDLVTFGAKISGIIYENFSEDLPILVGKYYNTTTLEWVLFRFYFYINLVSQLNSCFSKHALPTLKLHRGILIVHLVALQCYKDALGA